MFNSAGRKRSGGVSSSGGTGEAEQTLNQLLVEMDGIASKEGVVMLASTNRADVLDKVDYIAFIDKLKTETLHFQSPFY